MVLTFVYCHVPGAVVALYTHELIPSLQEPYKIGAAVTPKKQLRYKNVKCLI